MTNSEGIDQNNKDSNTAIRAAELAVFGEVISTIGDLISTIAAVLALEEARQEEIDNKNMQKQIDYLTNELKKLKKQVNNEKP
ncbi:hypothetical protein [Sporosarcina psychrophila]|uniref:hypothetical protein n=1 Tax=Sporosarcina psychrophila TaxID=1476 RepID=UPI00078B6D74|nr:hypothetical protein [Sporosarcina psychrophila]AMQ06756.1 hypothetical protein AZE41_12885 [Sporosarcina psychrophila]